MTVKTRLFTAKIMSLGCPSDLAQLIEQARAGKEEEAETILATATKEWKFPKWHAFLAILKENQTVI